MNRKNAIESAKKRLDDNTKLKEHLSEFGVARVFPMGCGDLVTFTIEEVPVLMAEFQNIKTRA